MKALLQFVKCHGAAGRWSWVVVVCGAWGSRRLVGGGGGGAAGHMKRLNKTDFPIFVLLCII